MKIKTSVKDIDMAVKHNRTITCMIMLTLMVALGFAAAGPAKAAEAAKGDRVAGRCTAENGQLFINSPVVGSDDYIQYFAGFNWVAGVTGTYRLRVTSFESVSAGKLVVTRD